MKKTIIAAASALFLAVTAFAQNTLPELDYRLSGFYVHPLPKEKLAGIFSLSDLVPDYPSRWINEYLSVEIAVTVDGKTTTASGTDDRLTAAQKDLLTAAIPGSDVGIHVNYRSPNVVTRAVVDNQMEIQFVVVPETEAQLAGGPEYLHEFLTANGLYNMRMPQEFAEMAVRFTVNENGYITHARITRTSGNEKTDRLLLDTITRLPRWKPAENARGVKVKQNFEFRVMRGGGC